MHLWSAVFTAQQCGLADPKREIGNYRGRRFFFIIRNYIGAHGTLLRTCCCHVSRPVNVIVHCREPSVVSCAMRFERIPIFFPIYVAASCHSLREISLGRSCPIYRSDIFSWVGSGWRPVYVMRLSGPLIKTPVTSTTLRCAHNQRYTKTLIRNTETEQVVK